MEKDVTLLRLRTASHAYKEYLQTDYDTGSVRNGPGLSRDNPLMFTFSFYLILWSLLRGSGLMYCTKVSNGWWERFWSALGSCTVQETSVADGSASEVLQTYEQYMEMYTPSMYSTGDVHLTVYCT